MADGLIKFLEPARRLEEKRLGLTAQVGAQRLAGQERRGLLERQIEGREELEDLRSQNLLNRPDMQLKIEQLNQLRGRPDQIKRFRQSAIESNIFGENTANIVNSLPDEELIDTFQKQMLAVSKPVTTLDIAREKESIQRTKESQSRITRGLLRRAESPLGKLFADKAAGLFKGRDKAFADAVKKATTITNVNLWVAEIENALRQPTITQPDSTISPARELINEAIQ